MDTKIVDYFNMVKFDKSQNTARAYENSVVRFVNHFDIADDITKISNISPEMFRQYIYSLNLSPESANGHIRNISAFISWLKNSEYIVDEKITGTKFGSSRFLKEQKKQVVTLTNEECRELIRSASDIQVKFMIALMLSTGVRRGELVSIKLQDVDFETGEILIKGKGGKERFVAVSETILNMMNMYMATHDKKSNYLFYSTRADGAIEGRLSEKSVGNRIKTALDNTSISEERKSKITAHKLRATLATSIIEQAGIEAARQVLGHASLSTTQRYNNSKLAIDALKNYKVEF